MSKSSALGENTQQGASGSWRRANKAPRAENYARHQQDERALNHPPPKLLFSRAELTQVEVWTAYTSIQIGHQAPPLYSRGKERGYSSPAQPVQEKQKHDLGSINSQGGRFLCLARQRCCATRLDDCCLRVLHKLSCKPCDHCKSTTPLRFAENAASLQCDRGSP